MKARWFSLALKTKLEHASSATAIESLILDTSTCSFSDETCSSALHQLNTTSSTNTLAFEKLLSITTENRVVFRATSFSQFCYDAVLARRFLPESFLRKHIEQIPVDIYSGFELFNLVNALAFNAKSLKRSSFVSDFFSRLSRRQPRIVDASVLPKDVSRFLQSCSQLGCKNKAWLSRLERDLQQSNDLLTATLMGESLMHFASMDYYPSLLLPRLVEDYPSWEETLTNESLVSLSQAISRLRYYDFKLCKFFSQSALRLDKAGLAAPSTLTKLLLGFAKQNYTRGEYISLICKRIVSQPSTFSGQDLVHFMYACCVLDCLKMAPVQAVFNLNCAVSQIVKRNVQCAQQLCLINVAWKQQGFDSSQLLHQLSGPEHGAWAHKLIQADFDQNLRSSPAHKEAFQLLSTCLRQDLCNEVQVLPGVWVDILVPTKKVVVEIDGSEHFFANVHTPSPLGTTLFKQRLLERAGFKIYRLKRPGFMLGPDHRRNLQKFADEIKLLKNVEDSGRCDKVSK